MKSPNGRTDISDRISLYRRKRGEYQDSSLDDIVTASRLDTVPRCIFASLVDEPPSLTLECVIDDFDDSEAIADAVLEVMLVVDGEVIEPSNDREGTTGGKERVQSRFFPIFEFDS